MLTGRGIAIAGKSFVLVIAVLILLHLFAVHGHGDVTALEACLVLLIPLTAASAAGVLMSRPGAFLTPFVMVKPSPSIWNVRRLLPVDLGTVMRH